jgi:hypothetical protein
VIVHEERYEEVEDQKLIDAFDEKYLGLKIEITKERLETIEQVCREANGEEFARRCVKRIKENGYINPTQRYFGLHYRANSMPKGNDTYLKLMKEFGFNWFKKFHLFEDKTT